MAFYNEQGERVTAVFFNGVLISDNPNYINFTGNVEVEDDGNGGVIVNVLGSAMNFVFGEVVVGDDQTFTLAHTPIETISLAANGQVLTLGTDYTILGAVITMLSHWGIGTVNASYKY